MTRRYVQPIKTLCKDGLQCNHVLIKCQNVKLPRTARGLIVWEEQYVKAERRGLWDLRSYIRKIRLPHVLLFEIWIWNLVTLFEKTLICIKTWFRCNATAVKNCVFREKYSGGKVCGKLHRISINRLPVVVIAVHCLLIFITWNAFVKAFRPNQVKKSGGKMGI